MRALQPALPTQYGSFHGEPLAQVLARLVAERATGTLELSPPDGSPAHVVVVGGRLQKVRADKPPLYLGSVAYELGYIDVDALNSTLIEVARSRRPHGGLLVARGLLTPAQLEHCLSEQTSRKLHRLFTWPLATKYAFFPNHDALGWFGGKDWPLRDLAPCIWYGIREFPPLRHVAQAVNSLGGAQFQLAPDTDPSTLGLTAEELTLAMGLRQGPLDLGGLAQLSTIDRLRFELLLYMLLLTGHLERQPRKATSGVQTKAARPAWDPKAATKLFERAYAAAKAGKLHVAEVLCREADDVDPDEVNHNALRIWLRALRPEGRGELATRRAIGALDRLIEAHDECTHAHFFRGQLYKRIGLEDLAASDFRSVLEHDPKRLDAAAELRLMASRRRRGS